MLCHFDSNHEAWHLAWQKAIIAVYWLGSASHRIRNADVKYGLIFLDVYHHSCLLLLQKIDMPQPFLTIRLNLLIIVQFCPNFNVTNLHLPVSSYAFTMPQTISLRWANEPVALRFHYRQTAWNGNDGSINCSRSAHIISFITLLKLKEPCLTGSLQQL